MFTSSCRNYYYIPNTPNVSLPEKKGDVEIRVGLSEGVDIQASYSPANNIGIMFNHNYYELENDNIGSEIGRTSEIGLGLYGTSTSKFFRYSIFGGLGKHIYDGRYRSVTNFSDLEANKSFIQLNLGVKGKFMEYALFYRISNLHYTKVIYEVDEELNQGDRMYLDTLATKRDIGYLTVGMMLGFGFEKFKLQFSGSIKGRTTKMPSMDSSALFPYRLGILLSYNFNTKDLFKQAKPKRSNESIWAN